MQAKGCQPSQSWQPYSKDALSDVAIKPLYILFATAQ
jgi:hypothetical protein